jgi:hypothetical protein
MDADIDTSNTPQSAQKMPNILPGIDVGDRSPYPTVVTVIIPHQSEAGMLSYFGLENESP